MSDAFRDRLAQVAGGTPARDLAHQSQGRAPSDREQALANAMMEIMGNGTHDFAEVAAQLASRGIVGPKSGATDWTEALLLEELSEANASFDAAYAENGYGA